MVIFELHLLSGNIQYYKSALKKETRLKINQLESTTRGLPGFKLDKLLSSFHFPTGRI